MSKVLVGDGRISKVLVVEDDAASRYANARILKDAGFEVWEAATGTAALELVRREPDLILLDIHLPDISGLDVCRAVKLATTAIPVLHLTATYGAPSEQALALESGADAYLTHPVEPIVLVATIRALLRARKAELQAFRLTAWWQSTFDSIGDGVVLIDRDGSIIRCNKAWADLVGSTPTALVGQSANPFLPGVEEPPEGWPLKRAMRDKRRSASEMAVGERWYEVVADPVLNRDGEVSALVRTAKDVTARKRADAQVAELLRLEQSAREEAEKLNRLKDEFLATLSHELRTPLNAIVGWVQLLRLGGLDEEHTAKAIDTIARNAHQQSQLISDILDVSRIVEGKLRLDRRTSDLARVVAEAWETVKPAAEAKDIAFEFAVDPAATTFYADPDRLQQVVWNLFSNGVKFTPQHGRIRASLQADASGVWVRVEDSGPGIDPKFLPYVFDRFRQADASSTRPHAGLGLGLAIVRHLVELHGGTVVARNRTPDAGALFEIWLPRTELTADSPPFPSELAPPVPPPRVPAPTSLEGTKVLIVDDDQDARSLMGLVLERAGASVEVAASADEGFRALLAHRPDVLLADVEMPGTDGYALIAAVRALPPVEGGATPAAAITAYARDVDRKRALQAGFQRHVAKPVEPAELVAAVAELKAETAPA